MIKVFRCHLTFIASQSSIILLSSSYLLPCPIIIPTSSISIVYLTEGSMYHLISYNTMVVLVSLFNLIVLSFNIVTLPCFAKFLIISSGISLSIVMPHPHYFPLTLLDPPTTSWTSLLLPSFDLQGAHQDYSLLVLRPSLSLITSYSVSCTTFFSMLPLLFTNIFEAIVKQ